jgi:hypothetical protein
MFFSDINKAIATSTISDRVNMLAPTNKPKLPPMAPSASTAASAT